MKKTIDRMLADWTSLLGKLGTDISRSDMTWVLLVMLANARSKNDLRRLHEEVLPRHLRLCRNDFIAIEKFWGQYFEDGSADALSLLGDTLLLLPNNSVSLEGYYAHLIEARANKVYTFASYLDYWGSIALHPILPSEKREGHGYYHHKVVVFGQVFELACSYAENIFRVRLLTYSKFLTEELTHRIISDLPSFDLDRSGFGGDKGEHLGLVYDFDDDDLPELLEDGWGKLQFVNGLIERLIKIGIPIESSCIVE